MHFITILSIFVLACFVGYYVVWSVTLPCIMTGVRPTQDGGQAANERMKR